MIWKTFDTAIEKELVSVEINSIKENNEALVCSLWRKFYIPIQKFSKIQNIDWSKVKFGLVDDNWTSDNSQSK